MGSALEPGSGAGVDRRLVSHPARRRRRPRGHAGPTSLVLRLHPRGPMKPFTCRFCAAPLQHTFADLGMSPLANSYVPAERANAMEPFYPLHAYVCGECFLVQLGEFESPEHIFSDYAYF